MVLALAPAFFIFPALCEDLRSPPEACCDCTVVLELPSFTLSCSQVSEKATIYNATDVQALSFLITEPTDSEDNVPYNLIIRAETNETFTLRTERIGDATRCTVLATEERMGREIIEVTIEAEVRGTPCWPAPSVLLAAEAFSATDSTGGLFYTTVISGGIHSLRGGDQGFRYLRGTVYYADGKTPYDGALLESFYIDGMRLDFSNPLEGIAVGHGSYEIWDRPLLIRNDWRPNPLVNLSVRYRVGDRCGPCSNFESTTWSLLENHFSELDIILPVEPPNGTPLPTSTPSLTPTPAPTFVNRRSDIDFNGTVGVKDLFIFQEYWYEAGPVQRLVSATWDDIFVEGCQRNRKDADGQWITKAPMPTNRGTLGVATVGDRVYALGGFAGETGRSAANEVYNAFSDAWDAEVDLPVPRSQFGIGVVGGRIYCMGGRQDGSLEMDRNDIYEPENQRWSQRAPMLTGRANLAVAAVDGRLYAIGGFERRGGKYECSEKNEMYDPDVNIWCHRAPMPTARDGLAVGVFADKIYAIGGRIGNSTIVSTVEEYDTFTDAWSEMNQMPTARAYARAACLNRLIYVFGGRTQGLQTVGITEAYDPLVDTWSDAPSMPTARGSHGVDSVLGRLYVVGGYDQSGNAVATNEQFTPPEPGPTSTPTATDTPPPSPTPSPTWTFDAGRPDIDENDIVNALDLLILLKDWQKVSGP